MFDYTVRLLVDCRAKIRGYQRSYQATVGECPAKQQPAKVRSARSGEQRSLLPIFSAGRVLAVFPAQRALQYLFQCGLLLGIFSVGQFAFQPLGFQREQLFLQPDHKGSGVTA